MTTATPTRVTIEEFFIALSKDADLLAAFTFDREQALEESGLSPDDRELVASGDIDRIHDALRGEGDGWDSIVCPPLGTPGH